MLDRNSFLAIPLPVKKVLLPDAGPDEFVYVRGLTSTETDKRQRDNDRAKKQAGKDNVTARLAALVICDADGKRLYVDEDWEVLGNVPHRILNLVCEAAIKLNGWGRDEIEKLEGESLPTTS